MNIKPLIDNVLIKPDEQKKTKGGIELPDSAQKEKPQEGTVVAVGPGRKFINQTYTQTNTGGGASGGGISFSEMTVKPGDRVLYKKWSGDEVKHNGEDYVMIQLDNIMAVLEEDRKN